jgi:hypothetical protein
MLLQGRAALSAARPLYWLAPHVYVCRTDDHVVLLDLQRDEYLGIADADSDLLARFVADWPGRASRNGESQHASTLLDDFLEAGILTRDPRAGKPATILAVPRAQRGLLDDYSPVRTRVSSRDACRFSAAVITAKWLLRRKSVAPAVMHVRGRQAVLPAEAARSEPVDESRARDAVAIFERLRPFLTTSRDACLFDSLALSEFLAPHGMFPQWIFGVATRPFAAHCWLQEGGLVYNDTPDNVRRFTPIMAV